MVEGTEVANILVGQVDFLDKAVMALVRLGVPAVLGDWTEVCSPTRFIFVCLGPFHEGDLHEYEEIGRSIGSLFTDKVYKRIYLCINYLNEWL